MFLKLESLWISCYVSTGVLKLIIFLLRHLIRIFFFPSFEPFQPAVVSFKHYGLERDICEV